MASSPSSSITLMGGPARVSVAPVGTAWRDPRQQPSKRTRRDTPVSGSRAAAGGEPGCGEGRVHRGRGEPEGDPPATAALVVELDHEGGPAAGPHAHRRAGAERATVGR